MSGEPERELTLSATLGARDQKGVGESIVLMRPNEQVKGVRSG